MDSPRKLLLAALLTAGVPVLACAQPAPDDCAATLSALSRMEGWLLRTWRETSMADGKPLVVSFSQEDGELHLHFHKMAEGPWARGKAQVCRRGLVLEAQLSAVQLGPAAPWLLRHSLGRNPVFVLKRHGALELHIAAPGWSGLFMSGQ